MALQNLLQNERMEMLKWVSERNMHVPLSELAFMLDLSEDNLVGTGADMETASGLYDYRTD